MCSIPSRWSYKTWSTRVAYISNDRFYGSYTNETKLDSLEIALRGNFTALALEAKWVDTRSDLSGAGQQRNQWKLDGKYRYRRLRFNFGAAKGEYISEIKAQYYDELNFYLGLTLGFDHDF